MDVIVDGRKVIRRVFINGAEVEPDHEAAVALVDAWTPPARFAATGFMDHVAVYDRALDPDAIARHYDPH